MTTSPEPMRQRFAEVGPITHIRGPWAYAEGTDSVILNDSVLNKLARDERKLIADTIKNGSFITDDAGIEVLQKAIERLCAPELRGQALKALIGKEVAPINIMFIAVNTHPHPHAIIGGVNISLTTTEYLICQELLLREGRIVSSTDLAFEAYGREDKRTIATLHARIDSLMKKLEKEVPGSQHFIEYHPQTDSYSMRNWVALPQPDAEPHPLSEGPKT